MLYSFMQTTVPLNNLVSRNNSCLACFEPAGAPSEVKNHKYCGCRRMSATTHLYKFFNKRYDFQRQFFWKHFNFTEYTCYCA